VDQVHRIADRLDRRIVLKAQVLTGGRSQAGGILLANDADKARNLAEAMLGVPIGGYPTSKLLVEEAIDVDQEMYVGITIDRSLARPVMTASAQGGIEIAEVAHDTPEHVYRVLVDPLLGLRSYQVRSLAEDIGLARERVDAFVSIALGLYQAFVDCDATLVEANPLVIRPDGSFCCLNSLIVTDDRALFRHPDLLELRDESQDIVPERLARRHGIVYVRLGGQVGCLSNGAGLAMATIDALRTRGVRPANFVDVGKGARADKVVRGLALARNNSVETVLVNVFCSITSCIEIAQGIVTGREALRPEVFLAVCLKGPDAEAGRSLLTDAAQSGQHPEICLADSLSQVVDLVVAHAQSSQPGGHGG
jgi:succinyl-CoA synthetase beta subunit